MPPPPPPPPSAGPGAPPAPQAVEAGPVSHQSPPQQPEPKGTITFGGLIGDSFSRGSSQTQHTFMTQQDFQQSIGMYCTLRVISSHSSRMYTILLFPYLVINVSVIRSVSVISYFKVRISCNSK